MPGRGLVLLAVYWIQTVAGCVGPSSIVWAPEKRYRNPDTNEGAN